MQRVVIVDGQQVRVLQPRDQARFAAKTLQAERIGRQGTVNHLDRDEAFHAGLVGAENRRHAALAEFFDDFVLAEPGSYHARAASLRV